MITNMHHNFKNRQGEYHITNEGYTIKIINYTGSENCDIQFESGVIVTNVRYYHIKKGSIKNPYHPRVYGIGFIGEGKYRSSEGYNLSKSYKVWAGFLNRCYNNKYHENKPTYKDVTVCEEWHNFQNFAKWFEENYVEGWHLDKDILVKGNKVYSPETCCFVPQEINNEFKGYNRTQKLPKGVYYNKNKFQCDIRRNGKTKYIGLYNTPEEAFVFYKKDKEYHIRKLADKYKEDLDPKVYKTLHNYKVEINNYKYE